LDGLPPDEVRSAQAIARRALALFGVVGHALGAPRDDITGWLKEEGLWEELSPTELAYLTAGEPTERQSMNASWRSEALIVLLWAIGKVEALPAPNEQCDTALFQDLLPPFAETSVMHFIASARRRSETDLMTMADKLMNLHWEARDAKVRARLPPLDIEVVQERHHAINWVMGYDSLPWDEVTTDT
jgi:hypothetical protein